jgi:hypothetical protein
MKANSIPTAEKQVPMTTILGLALVLAGLGQGCGMVKVRHVPKPASIHSAKDADLQSAQPVAVRNGQTSSEEQKIGTVGVGKVFGKLDEWTGAAVSSVKEELARRGATVSEAAPKVVTLSVTEAEVRAMPFVGVSTSKVSLNATTADGASHQFTGSSSSMAPLKAVDGAMTEALKAMFKDPSIEAYLRK